MRDKVFAQRKLLKEVKVNQLGLGLRGDGNIFVNENLLAATKDLLYKANRTRKEKGYRFLWTSNGKVLVKKSAETLAIVINSEADLDKIN